VIKVDKKIKIINIYRWREYVDTKAAKHCVKCERVRTRRILDNRCRDVLSVDRNGQARHIRRSATHLRLQLIDGVDKNIVVLLQPLELPSTISKYVGYGPGPTAAAAARADPPRPPSPPARAPGLPTRARAPRSRRTAA
jgi:hypothetical protein